MKHGRIILGALLLLIADAAILVYIFTQNLVTSLPWYLLAFLLVFGIFALLGAIAWLAGWLPRKKTPAAEPQSTAVETLETEARQVSEEETAAEPKPDTTEKAVTADAEHVAEEEAAVEPSYMADEEVAAEPVEVAVEKEAATEEPKHMSEAEIERARRLVEGSSDRGLSIMDLEGVGSVYAEKLNAVNIYKTSDLLKVGATPEGRSELVAKLGVSDKLVLEWVNMADLLRVRGVGEEYSDLLEEAGVDTVVELAKRVPENLHARLREVNAEKHLVRRVPTLKEVTRWVEEAKTLPRRVEY
jgi:predicted flap endonuclease-1-like 5' DNA nuclease